MKKLTYLLFEYVNENGEEITRDQFYQQHPGVVINLDQLALLEHDINTWCTLLMNEFFEKNIEINSFTRKFVFTEGDKMYFLFQKFRVRYIKVFFEKKHPLIQIFDIKVA